MDNSQLLNDLQALYREQEQAHASARHQLMFLADLRQTDYVKAMKLETARIVNATARQLQATADAITRVRERQEVVA